MLTDPIATRQCNWMSGAAVALAGVAAYMWWKPNAQSDWAVIKGLLATGVVLAPWAVAEHGFTLAGVNALGNNASTLCLCAPVVVAVVRTCNTTKQPDRTD